MFCKLSYEFDVFLWYLFDWYLPNCTPIGLKVMLCFSEIKAFCFGNYTNKRITSYFLCVCVCVFCNLFLKAQMCGELQGLAVTSAYLPHCRARGQRSSVGGEGQLCSNSPGIPGWEEEKGYMCWVKEQMISVSWPKGLYFNTHVHIICTHLLLFC